MKHQYYIVFVFVVLTINHTTQPISFKSIWDRGSSLVGRKKGEEEILHRQYNCADNGILNLKNINGTIRVKTESPQNSVFLKATKQASKKELLQNVKIIESSDKDTINVRTVYTNNKVTGSVQYDLIVPADITINLATHDGDIKIKQINGAITAITEKGNVEIEHAGDTIMAKSTQKGNINIAHAKGNVQAETAKGNISIDGAQQSIIAHADYGKITVASNEVPSTSKIDLQTGSGIIELALPHEVNADLQARTKNGQITSNHYITLKPQTTQLNNKTWNRLKKEINGTLGTGEAQIMLTSNKGNIKLLETKTT